MLVATPLGLGAGIYLSEYASPRVRRTLKPVLEILASIPSVVLGFFALTWLSPNIVQPLTGAPLSNMAAAGLAVGILITPLVASVSEDAMHAVPQYLREAAYGLGARKRTTTLQVVFPAAVSGIVAALLLGVSRAIGETMIVAIAAGGTGGSLFQINPFEPGQTMTAAMTALAIGSDKVRGAELDVREPLLRRASCCSSSPWSSTCSAMRSCVACGGRTDGRSAPRLSRPARPSRRASAAGGSDLRGAILEGLLLLSLLIALGVLVVLVADIVHACDPGLHRAPVDFLTAPLSCAARRGRGSSRASSAR